MRTVPITVMVMLTAVLVALPVSHFSSRSPFPPPASVAAQLTDSSSAAAPRPQPAITVTDELVRATVVKSSVVQAPKPVRAPVSHPAYRKPSTPSPAPPPARRSALARIFLGKDDLRPQPVFRIRLP